MNRAALAGCAGALVLAVGIGVALLPRGGGGGGPTPEIGGPFTLVDGAGRTVTERSFEGKWRLVYFGYTHCPDACPATLGDIGAALDQLPPPSRARLTVLFITVDPARDTPPVVSDYAHAFGPEFTGLTGSPAQIAQIETAFHVYARRHDLAGGDYAIDHSSIIYVMRPDGGFAGLLDDDMKPAELARRLAAFGV